MTDQIALTVRPARDADFGALRRLEALDSARSPLARPVLLAETAGRAVAAVSIADGRAVADPFARTADAVALLRLRACHLAGVDRPERRRWRAAAALRFSG